MSNPFRGPRVRPETGPMCFESDWTGVFVRGDTAAWFAEALREVLKDAKWCVHTPMVEGLAELFEESREGPTANPNLQEMKPFTECTK